MRIPSLLLAATLAALTGMAWAGPGNSASQALVTAGQVLDARGDARAAYAKYQEAFRADAQNSQALALMADMLFRSAAAAPAQQAKNNLAEARRLAEAALAIDANDPVAPEVLRKIEDGTPPPLHEPNAAAHALLSAGEALFVQHDYAGALAQYQAAAAADPAYSGAWVFAGDCHFMQGDYARAEQLFQRALEVEPLNSQALRFLADALARQKKPVEPVIVRAIEADPGQLQNWYRLELMRQNGHFPLRRLGLVIGASVSRDASTGKANVSLLSSASKERGDMALWLAYAMAKFELQATERANGTPLRPFALELQTWRKALQLIVETEQTDPAPPHDPALRELLALHRDGQLEAGLLFLTYRESYRQELEDWKRAHPQGLLNFIDTYRLRP